MSKLICIIKAELLKQEQRMNELKNQRFEKLKKAYGLDKHNPYITQSIATH